MGFLRVLEVSVGRTSRTIALIGLGGLLLLALAIVLDVFCRWLFNSPIAGVRDLTGLFVAIIIAASIPTCLAGRSNITIRFLGTFLGSWCRELLDLFGNIVTLIVLAVMAWEFWLYANALSRSNEKTWILFWPVSPWYYGVAILISICVFVQLVVTLLLIRELIRHFSSTQGPARETTHEGGEN